MAMAARILTLRLGCCCYSPRSVPRVLPITLFYCPARSLNPTTALSNPTTSSSSSLRGTTETWLPALRSPVRCVSSEAAGEGPRMPARLAQKQAALNAQPVYDDLDQPVPKISLGEPWSFPWMRIHLYKVEVEEGIIPFARCLFFSLHLFLLAGQSLASPHRN